jgi:hypothetical protein
MKKMKCGYQNEEDIVVYQSLAREDTNHTLSKKAKNEEDTTAPTW